MEIGQAVGLVDPLPAPDEGFDFGSRKNEPIFGGIVGDIAVPVHAENLSGIDHLVAFLFTTFRLDLA